MIKFQVYGPLPRSMVSNSCHFIATRSSLFGIHRNLNRIDFDTACTKTTLLGFAEQEHAQKVLERLDYMQRNGVDINRISDGNEMSTTNLGRWRASIAPLKLESMRISELERLCLLHYFDMYIVANLDVEQNNDLTLICYENKTYEWPNRDILDRFMRDMYQNDT